MIKYCPTILVGSYGITNSISIKYYMLTQKYLGTTFKQLLMKNNLLLLLILIVHTSCSTIEYPSKEFSAGIQTKSASIGLNEAMILGSKLTNPYSRNLMQAAYDSLFPEKPIILPVTDLYVRFLPQDHSEMKWLLDDGLELFDYPLDREIIQDGRYYRDPEVNDSLYTWQYTTVKPGYVFPSNIRYEILESCYIPDNTTIRSNEDFSALDLERKAFQLAGLDSMWIEPSSRASARPIGRFTVTNTENGKNEGIKGVKVRMHNVVKWDTTYTNYTGFYRANKEYRTNVHYALIFENSTNFSIYETLVQIFRANHRMGFHSNNGYSKNIGTNDKTWHVATINNAGYEYYASCRRNNIITPPDNLTIYNSNWDYLDYNGTPMLGHIGDLQVQIGHSFARFLTTLIGSILDDIVYMIRMNPDIIVYTENKNNTRNIYSLLFHELSHASHFSQVGAANWCRYITYICDAMTQQGNCYGDGTLIDAGVCEVGEMWGYFHEDVMTYEYFDGGTDEKLPSSIDYWFEPGVHALYSLYQDNILSTTDIFNSLTPDVDTRDKLQTKLKLLNPELSKHIDISFAENGIYSALGEWLIVNRTGEKIYLNLERDKRPIPTTSTPIGRIGIPIDTTNFKPALFSGVAIEPNDSLIIAIYPDALVSAIASSHLWTKSEICPTQVTLADSFGIIFLQENPQSLTKEFFNQSNWAIDYTTTWNKKRWMFIIDPQDIP